MNASGMKEVANVCMRSENNKQNTRGGVPER